MEFKATWMVLQSIAIAAILAYVIEQVRTRISRKAILGRLPFLDASKDDVLAVTHRGYVEYLKRGQPFRLRVDPAGVDDMVLLPFKYLDEVKEAPESALSFLLFSDISMLLQYSNAPRQTPACTYAMKNSLNRNLSGLVPLIHAGIAKDVAAALPQKGEWTKVPLYPTLVKIVARNAVRVLADPELCDNEEWLKISIDVTQQTFMAGSSIRKNFSPIWWWLARYFDKPSQIVLKGRQRAAEIMKPIYQQHKSRSGTHVEPTPQYSTGLTWLLSAPGRKQPSAQEVADDLLFLSIAGIHTTAASLMTMICDLFALPEVCEALRQEINENYPESGAWWTAPQLSKLPQLDSFMKESQRMHSIGLFAMSRAPPRNYKFRDGLEIPANTMVRMANHELNMDPDIHVEADRFDAKRFLNLKDSTGSGKFGFTSIASDYSINFGAGNHTCPGRNLASTVMKIVLIEMLKKYEVKFEEGKGQPAIIASRAMRLTDPTTALMVRNVV